MSAKQQNNTGEFQTGNVIAVSAAHLLHDIYSSFLAPVLPLLIEKLNISYSLSSFLAVVQRLPSVINPFVGLLADKISMRYLVIVAPTITAISMSLLGLAPSYTVLFIMLLVMGVSSALFHVPSPVMIRKVAGSKAGMGMSFFMLGGELARTLGPLTILGAISLWSFEGTYRLIPFAVAASGFLYFKLGDIAIHSPVEKQQKLEGKRATIIKYMPFFLIICGYLFFTAIIKSSLTFYLPTFLKERGKSLWTGGISLSIFQFAGAVGTFLSGTLSDKIGRKKLLFIVSVITPFVMWLFVYFQASWLGIPLLVLLGIFVFASQPILLAIVNTIQSDRPAFINGIYMSVIFIVPSISVMLVGAVADRIGLVLTYQINAFLGLGGIPFAVLLWRNKS